MVVDVHQGPPVIRALEFTLEPATHVADPKRILVVPGVPFPFPLVRTIPALAAHAHHVRREGPPDRYLQPAVVELDIPLSFERELKVDVTVELHSGAGAERERSGRRFRLQHRRRWTALHDLGLTGLPRKDVPVRLDDERERTGKNLVRT